MSFSESVQLLGNLGEFVGSIAVLVTLIYLALQVKQANHQLTVAGMQARAQHARGLLEPLYTDQTLGEILQKAGHPPYGEFGLDPNEAFRFGAFWHAWMQTEQGSYYLLPKGSHDELRTMILSIPSIADFWDKNKGIYDVEFAEYMDGLKKNLESAPRTAEEILAGNS